MNSEKIVKCIWNCDSECKQSHNVEILVTDVLS